VSLFFYFIFIITESGAATSHQSHSRFFFFLPICRLLQWFMVRCGHFAPVYHKSDHSSGFTTESILSEYLHECCVYVCI